LTQLLTGQALCSAEPTHANTNADLLPPTNSDEVRRPLLSALRRAGWLPAMIRNSTPPHRMQQVRGSSAATDITIPHEHSMTGIAGSSR
jgi:hypothetical protein